MVHYSPPEEGPAGFPAGLNQSGTVECPDIWDMNPGIAATRLADVPLASVGMDNYVRHADLLDLTVRLGMGRSHRSTYCSWNALIDAVRHFL